MKKEYFIFELMKSGPFVLLLIIAVLILMGIMISNHHQNKVRMKEDVLYVTPRPMN